MIEQLGNTLLGFAEMGGNRLLGMDPQVLQHCNELQGNIIAIELTDIQKTIYCHPGSWGMRLSLQKPGKEVDSTTEKLWSFSPNRLDLRAQCLSE